MVTTGASWLLKSRSVSLFRRTHRPYAPTIVPRGMLIRLIADKTMPTMRAQDLKLMSPYPVIRLGNEKIQIGRASCRERV